MMQAELKAEMERLEVSVPVLPAWVAEKQPQNEAYWASIYGWGAVNEKRVEIGEMSAWPEWLVVD